jgi:ankyrin repeat protein
MEPQDEFIGAVFSGNIALADELLGKGAKIGQDEILHLAAQQGNLEILRFLLKSGGTEFINQFDSLALTPLAWAAKNGDILSMKLLLEAGAQVNAVDVKNIGNTALREVIVDGNIQVIELLLSAGADPDIPGWMQMTARDNAKIQWENGKSERNRIILEMLNFRHTEAEKILSKRRPPIPKTLARKASDGHRPPLHY